MKRFTLLPGLSCLLALVMSAQGQAAEQLLPNPTEQPLAVFRARDAAVLESILETRLVRALSRRDGDTSFSLPGIGIRVESPDRFLTALARSGAEDAWFCLTQKGPSVARQGSVIGWDFLPGREADTREELDSWLRDNGVRPDPDILTEVTENASGGSRILIAPDRELLRTVIGGGTTGGTWRNSFAAFRDFPGPGLGVWVNTRPLFGFLSLMTGFDFRTKMTTARTSVPAGASVEFMPRGQNLGFTLRLDQVLHEEAAAPETPPLVARVQRDAMIEATFHTPGTILDLVPFDTSALFFLNLDAAALEPESLHFQAWLDDFGAPAWAATCLMPPGKGTNRQLRRIVVWLEILAKAIPDLTVTRTVSRWGDNLWEIRYQDVIVVTGIVEIAAAGQNNTFVVLAGSVDDWPEPSMLAVSSGLDTAVCSWKARFDGLTERAMATDAIQNVLVRAGEDGYDAAFFDALLPDKETGSVDFLGRDLVVRSDQGALPLLVMALSGLYFP